MEQVADRVWLVRGGVPRTMNVYLIEDERGMTMFDAGISDMPKRLMRAADKHGGIKRIVLGHSHPDHRGAAGKVAETTGAAIHCHRSEVDDAESDGGMHYFRFSRLPLRPGRFAMPLLLKIWDGGPLHVDEVLDEGDEVAGFQVVHVPGHAPGMIALYRESDGIVLSSDAVYTVDPLTGIPGRPRVPLDGFNLDTEVAKASLLKLSALSPKTLFPGHAKPLTEDTTAILEELGHNGGILPHQKHRAL
ncbi:MAG: MBL fold metallo-hydrolase [Solirubrobacterales bacterium]